jgi:hypothetical protein
VQQHALSLLRSGEISTFPALIRRVLEDVRHDTSNAESSTAAKGEVNGATTNGNNKKINGATANGGVAESTNLAVPAAVVDQVLKVARERLEAVCEIDDSAGG